MNKEKLSRLVTQYKKNIEFYRDSREFNEQDCRDEFISPLLESFGWDVHNENGTSPQYKEVVVEKYSNSGDRPDYTLTLNGVSKIFVEAKKPAVNIKEESNPAIQVRRYGWNAKHKLSILTNFEYLMIYDVTNKPQEGEAATVSLYRKYNYLEYLDKYEEIYELISRESVYSGKYDSNVESKFLDKNRYSTEVDEVFLKQINEWRLEIGSYLYYVDDNYKDIDVLNDVVQEFINQIIFLRICEDRNLPLYLSLKETTQDKEELQKVLTKVFKEADKRYNSKLFLGENIVFDLKNDIIYNIILSLYYPKTPYMFNIIEPGILGKIYESFLTESLVEKDGDIILAPKKEYKYRSVVSTPVEIVKYMVKNTLAPICDKKTPEEIKEIRIADIACGSGVFLEEAYQFLIDYCTEWYMEHNPEYLLELSNGKKKLPLVDKKDILINCIYGVDIDIHAVEVSKFSLLIKLLEDETLASVKECSPILPDLGTNIKNGNSLISREDINDKNLSIELLCNIKPFDWNEINKGMKFDAIIGNPPYVKTEDIHKLESDTEFKIYKKKYKSAYKQFDKYFLFIEKALNLLKEGGQLCYIVPNKFYKIEAGKKLRQIISKNISKLDDFGDMQLFPDKTIYSCIITVCKKNISWMKYTNVTSLIDLWTGKKQSDVMIKNKTLDENTWRLTTDITFMKMIDQVEECSKPLGEVMNIFNGIQTSAEKPEPVYWFEKDKVISETEEEIIVNKFEKEYHIEKSILKPFFKPNKIAEKGKGTYSRLKTDKRIIFPYNEDGSLISIDVMEENYPGTYRYLKDCYDLLVPKCLNGGKGRDIKNATEETWYQYGRTQALTAFVNTPKLIVRILSKEPMYAYDESNMLIASGGTAGYCAISKPPNSKYDLRYVQAWLNHPYTEKLLQIMGSDFEGGFTARGTNLLKKIPFVELDLKNERQKALYESIIMLVKKVNELNLKMEQKKDKASIIAIEAEKKNLEKQIEDNVTKIYNLQF